MKKKLSLIFLALFLFASASALALDDPGTFFDALIRNGPSQEVCAATKCDDNDTKIEIARLSFTGPVDSVSFRGYWGGERVTNLMTYKQGGSSNLSSEYLPNDNGFGDGCTVTLLGSIPPDENTPASASVGAVWYR